MLLTTNRLHFCQLYNRAILWHLFDYLIVRIITTAALVSFRQPLCIRNFFTLCHSATCHQHAALVSEWEPVRHWNNYHPIVQSIILPTCCNSVPLKTFIHCKIFHTIRLCDLPRTCNTFFCLTTVSKFLESPHHRTMWNFITTLSPCSAETRSAMVEISTLSHSTTYYQHAAVSF